MGSGFAPLSAQDESFLFFERPGNPMHVGALAVLEAGPACDARGRVDVDAIRACVASRLPLLPRYRQRLAFTPLRRQPLWVDHERFDVARHVRHATLPRPGSDAQLKSWIGRRLAEPLDRTLPLWELWVIDGLRGGRFAVLTKVHHCLVDGVAGSGLLTTLFRTTPERDVAVAPPFRPRPRAGIGALALEDVARTLRAAADVTGGVADALRDPARALDAGRRGATAVWHALRDGLRLLPPSPLRRPTGPARALDWCTLELAAIKDVCKRLDGTVNDVVLTVVTGALRELLRAQGGSLRGRELRAVVPVNMRATAERTTEGNRVAAWFVSLPVGQASPLARFERVRRATARAKASHAAEGIDLLVQLVDTLAAPRLVEAGTRLASWIHPHHLIVTNVAGPPAPLYLLGARMESLVPQLPLLAGETLGIAVLSYCGKVSFGLFADGARASELPALARAIRRSFASLRTAAERRDRMPIAT